MTGSLLATGGEETDFQDLILADFAFSPDGKSLAYSRGPRTRDALLVKGFRQAFDLALVQDRPPHLAQQWGVAQPNPISALEPR